MKYVYAKWKTDAIPAIEDVYVSCGAGSHQYPGYFLEDKRAIISIAGSKSLGYYIEFKAPSRGLEQKKNWWLSPTNLFDIIEAYDFGIKEE